jgi:hypothetical protein
MCPHTKMQALTFSTGTYPLHTTHTHTHTHREEGGGEGTRERQTDKESNMALLR